MVIMDGYSSFQTVAFLNSKSAETTLKVFQAYHIKTEQQTGRQLKKVRLNMGKKWYNNTWEDYQKSHGLIFEFTTSYAHQQNGAAKRSMCPILDRTQSALAESGLPLKFWAEAVQTVVYVRNFIPSSQQPMIVPAEIWYRQQQDISHL